MGDTAGRDRERRRQHQHHEHHREAALVEDVGEGADGDVVLVQQGLELIAQSVVGRLVAAAAGGLVHLGVAGADRFTQARVMEDMPKAAARPTVARARAPSWCRRSLTMAT
jgi:hypothetical protein